MSRYFTSDWHINSTNILKYANRPYKSWQSAAISLIEQCNAVASKNDCVFHVGDLIMLSNDRHDTIEDVLDANAYTLKDIKQQIAANFITVAGNHDSHNCEADCKSMVLDLNQNWRNVYVNHFPSDNPHYHGLTGRNGKIQINLCRHVHDSWKYYYDNKANVLNYNVGVDCHNYKPVRDAEITEDLDFLFKHHDFSTCFKMTCKDEIEWKKIIKNKLARDREVRKKTRYQKKGLTEAECLRRKEEALRKKGLLK